jgi:hypothetical protein
VLGLRHHPRELGAFAHLVTACGDSLIDVYRYGLEATLAAQVTAGMELGVEAVAFNLLFTTHPNVDRRSSHRLAPYLNRRSGHSTAQINE